MILNSFFEFPWNHINLSCQRLNKENSIIFAPSTMMISKTLFWCFTPSWSIETWIIYRFFNVNLKIIPIRIKIKRKMIEIRKKLTKKIIRTKYLKNLSLKISSICIFQIVYLHPALKISKILIMIKMVCEACRCTI